MKKSRVLATVLSAAMAAGLTACGSAPAGNNEKGAGEAASEYKVLNVGTMALTCGIPVLYAQEQGYFEEAGLDVNVELFATGAPINEAIAANQIDIAVSGFASVYSLANANCTWLADVNTTGGMGLYARADSAIAQNAEADGLIGDAENLKGMQILEPLGTAVQYMTESYAEKYGLTPSDINQVNMEYASAYQAFTTGEADAMAANPPYSYQLEEGGYAKLCSFEDATGVNMCDGCFARNEVVEKRPEEVQLFIDCLVKAMDDMQDDKLRSEYTRKVYDTNAITCSDADLAHEIEDRDYVGTEAMKESEYKLGEAWVAITDFLVNAEKITADNAPNVEKSINPSFVSKTIGTEVK
ncbi:MAG: ABC transporter substrate-binding protein [Eubacteriales bacterium]|nr:ABC transporter substrate-binding protein [Eubacteriales bacterium]